MSTEVSTKAVVLSPDRPTIMKMADDYKVLLTKDASVPEVYKEIHAAVMTCVKARASIDKHRKSLTEEWRKATADVNKQGKEAEALIEEIEKPLREKRDAVDRAKEAAALEKAKAIEAEQRAAEERRVSLLVQEAEARAAAAEAEAKRFREAEEARIAEARKQQEEERRSFQERNEAEKKRLKEERAAQQAELAAQREAEETNRMRMSEISGIQQQVIIAQIGRRGVREGGTIACIEETLAETEQWEIDEKHFGPVMAEVAGKAKKQAISQIKALLVKAKSDAAIEEERAAEAKRFKAEREANEACQREAQAKIDAERKKLDDEREAERLAAQKKIEDERRAKELEEAVKRAAAEALDKAERDRINAERIKREDDERAEQERQRQAAMAPDKEKLRVWIDGLSAVKGPDLKSKEAKEVFIAARNKVDTAIRVVFEFSEK